MKRLIWVFFAALAACDLVVDVDIPVAAPKVTLNSVFTPDSTWRVSLSLDRHILDDGPFHPVPDATVSLYENDALVATLPGDGGVYRWNGQPESGKVYRIEATTPSFGTVRSESALPLPVALGDTEMTERMVDGFPETTVKLAFKDDPASDNYYQIAIFMTAQHYDHFHDSIITRTYPVDMEILTPLTGFDGDDPGSVFFKDQTFAGKETEITLKFHGSIRHTSQITVALRNLSEDYFRYMSTLALQGATAENPFAQPVSVFNNIENGFGIFAGYSQDVAIRTSPPPVVYSIEPMEGRPGDIVTITGENLPREASHAANVSFRSWYGTTPPAEIVEQTPDAIKVAVPQQAVTGRIYISSNGRMIISETDFVVEN